ncbi:hypothetical protein HRbin03_00141 [archaeon HR03]|nr:hypothetical protein HRbin03_00141 [archaeon HR03]
MSYAKNLATIALSSTPLAKFKEMKAYAQSILPNLHTA